MSQKERDTESAYPEKAMGKDMHDWAKQFVDPATGSTLTPYVVSQRLAAELDSEYKKEFHDKPYFSINERLVIPDYTGDKYTTSHQCFGSPCRKYPDSDGTPYKNEWVQLGSHSKPYVDEDNYVVFPSAQAELE